MEAAEPASQGHSLPSVYSASNLLVLLNDGILRKELRKKSTRGKNCEAGLRNKIVTTSPCLGPRIMVSWSTRHGCIHLCL